VLWSHFIWTEASQEYTLSTISYIPILRRSLTTLLRSNDTLHLAIILAGVPMGLDVGYTEYTRITSDATGETAPRGDTYISGKLNRQWLTWPTGIISAK
jgi:hypothetical protein